MSELYELVNYTSDIDYLVGTYIREYDISKANINILLWKGVISIEEYNRLYVADRMVRQITIGKLERDNPEVTEILKAGIIEAKKLFFESNGIQDYQVLSIKNDAVYLIGVIPKYTKFGNVEFLCKNIYTSYYKVFKIQYFYNYDAINQKEVLDIKGIGEDRIALHKNFFYEFLCELLYEATMDSIENVILLIQHFSENYVNLHLDIEYYREFTPDSMYRIKHALSYMEVKAEHLPKDAKYALDISHNYNILREFYKMFSQIYFGKR